jgi:hypothetical protein
MNYARFNTSSWMARGPMISFDAPNDQGGGAASEGGESEDEGESEGEDTGADGEGEGESSGEGAADENKGKTKPSDAEAKLLKEAMKHKKAAKVAADALAAANAALEKYKGVDPEKVAKLLADQEAAELEAAEKRGEYERIKAQMQEQHNTTVASLQAQITERDNSLAAAMAQIDELTIGADFGNSKFLSEKTILSPKKARTLFGAHFDRVDGVTVAYDKPRGAKDRTPLVDANGDNLSFEAAIEKIVTSDEDFERIAKSKLKTGSASQGATHKTEDAGEQKGEVSGAARIALGLPKLAAAKK